MVEWNCRLRGAQSGRASYIILHLVKCRRKHYDYMDFEKGSDGTTHLHLDQTGFSEETKARQGAIEELNLLGSIWAISSKRY